MLRLDSTTLRLGTPETGTLELELQVNSTGQELLAVNYKLILGAQVLRSSLDPAQVEAISCQLEVQADRYLWDVNSLPDLSLASRLEILFLELSKSDLMRICGLYPRVLGLGPEASIAPSSPEESRRWVAKIFCAQVCLYLVWTELLYGDALWSLLPLKLPLPWPELDQRVLTEKAFSICRTHLALLKISSHPLLREVEWQLTNFYHLWGDYYQSGPEGCLELSSALLTMSGLLTEIWAARTARLVETNAGLQTEVAQQQRRIASLESRLALMERRLAPSSLREI